MELLHSKVKPLFYISLVSIIFEKKKMHITTIIYIFYHFYCLTQARDTPQRHCLPKQDFLAQMISASCKLNSSMDNLLNKRHNILNPLSTFTKTIQVIISIARKGVAQLFIMLNLKLALFNP